MFMLLHNTEVEILPLKEAYCTLYKPAIIAISIILKIRIQGHLQQQWP